MRETLTADQGRVFCELAPDLVHRLDQMSPRRGRRPDDIPVAEKIEHVRESERLAYVAQQLLRNREGKDAEAVPRYRVEL